MMHNQDLKDSKRKKQKNKIFYLVFFFFFEFSQKKKIQFLFLFVEIIAFLFCIFQVSKKDFLSTLFIISNKTNFGTLKLRNFCFSFMQRTKQ